LKKAVAAPLGQVRFGLWTDMVLRVQYLCGLYPGASTLFVAERDYLAVQLFCDLQRTLGRALGLRADQHIGEAPRCLVTTLAWLPRLRPGAWEVVFPVASCGRSLRATAAAWPAFVGLQARRVYALVAARLCPRHPTKLRLEAISGCPLRVSDPFGGVAVRRRRRSRG
jgi:hypothetical protein